ncbi:MAG: GNAT family N-acetyltransferase [Noviherbaspirillum sp.]
MDVLVREATVEDAQLIAELTRAAWAGTLPVTSSGYRETAVRVRQDLQHGGGFILTADDVPAGSVRWLPLDSQRRAWEILRMGIVPAWRGHHLSQHLLEAVVHHAMVCDVDELRLAVPDRPGLLHLYAAFGFDIAHELDHTHANPMEPTPFVMRRLLGR